MIECAADSVQKRPVCPPREVFPLEGKVSRLCDLDSEAGGFFLSCEVDLVGRDTGGISGSVLCSGLRRNTPPRRRRGSRGLPCVIPEEEVRIKSALQHYSSVSRSKRLVFFSSVKKRKSTHIIRRGEPRRIHSRRKCPRVVTTIFSHSHSEKCAVCRVC